MPSFKKHIKETVKLAIPVSIGQLGHTMMGFVDSLMVGKLGAAPLAAAALVNGLFFLVLVIGIGMSMAITPLVAIAKGSRNNEECGVVLRQGLIVNLSAAVVLLGFIYFGSDLIIYLKQPADVEILAISYLRILGFSVIPFMLFQIYRQFLEGISDVNPPMYLSISANIVNAFLNWVLIFGNLGFEPMGLDGAGYATTTTRTIMALALMFYVIKSVKYREYDTSLKFRSINKKMIRKLIGIGLPSGLQYFLEVAAFAFGAIMVGWIGTVQLAAHQIAINLASATYMVILGISAAGTIRVGNAVGEKDIKNTRAAGFSAILLAASVMFVFAILFILFRNYLPLIYINDIEVIKLASSLLIVASLFQIFDGIQATAFGILRGLTDVTIPLIIVFASYWLFAIPLGFYLAFNLSLGAVGVWIGFAVGLLTVAVFLTLRFHLRSKKSVSF